MPLTEEEIDKEKTTKPRPDLVPPRAIMAAGRALGYGANKHGLGRSTWGTYRDAGTEQADIRTHIASFERHWQRFKQAMRDGTGPGVLDPESGQRELDCAMAQLSIIVDQAEDPPTMECGRPSKCMNEAKAARAAQRDSWELPKGLEWSPEAESKYSDRSQTLSYAVLQPSTGFMVYINKGGQIAGSLVDKHPELVELVKRRNGVEQ